MIKTILASLTGFSADHSVLETAIAAARIDGAHIQCLHTRIDPLDAAAMYKTLDSRRSDTLQKISREIAAEEEDRSTRARAEFDNACNRHDLTPRDAPAPQPGPSIAFLEVQTLFNETLHEARYHDLVVMGRDAELSSERIKSVLMQAGRPLLLAPPRPVGAIGRKVAIAWKEGPEAARALTAVSGILAQAEQVTLLCVTNRAADDEADRRSAELLAKQLLWHGVHAQMRIEHAPSADAAQKLREMAYGCEADLLVMGAYGHSRVREFVFGGVTRELLTDCAVPLLLLH